MTRVEHVLVLGLVLAAACEREHSLDLPRIPCTADRDCPTLPAGARCAYTCGPTICQLVAVLGHAGAGPCLGTRHDGASAFASQDALRAFGVCDAAAGLYCERASRQCAPAKPRGASCRTDDECSVDLRCDDAAQHCVPAGDAGASCATERCSAGLYCDEHARCMSRRALGAPCDFSDECSSLACERDHCVAAPAPVACPVQT